MSHPQVKVEPVPKGQPVVSPYLTVRGAQKLLDFLETTFGGRVTELIAPNGRIAHAQVRIGDSVVMIGESPDENVPAPAVLYVYVHDVDATYQRALQNGGSSVREPADQFYGDRSGAVKDPCGNTWWIAARIEELSLAEIEKRMQARTT
jgi:PhnB protein